MTQVTQRESANVEAPGAPFLEPDDSGLHTNAVYVVHTSIEETLSAVRVAGDFAKPLGVPVTLVHFRAVPFAAPLDGPGGISPVQTEAFLDRLKSGTPDVRVQVYHCRDVERVMQTAFGRPCLVVIGARGARRRWWPTRADRWRRSLEAAGHLVVLADRSEAPGPASCESEEKRRA